MRTDVWPAGPAVVEAGDIDGSAEPAAGRLDASEVPGLEPGFGGLAEHAAVTNPTITTVASWRLLNMDLVDIDYSGARRLMRHRLESADRRLIAARSHDFVRLATR